MKHKGQNKNPDRGLNRSGVSLTELIVAAAMVGIVTLGVISVDVALRNLQNSASLAQITAARASATLLRLATDAFSITGDAVDEGLRENSALGYKKLCLRQDNTDPTVTTDDIWVCYTSDNNRGQLTTCRPVDVSAFMAGGRLCRSSDPNFEILLPDNLAEPNWFTVARTPAGQIDYIEFNIVARNDASQSAHPLTNPEYRVNARISPMSLSR